MQVNSTSNLTSIATTTFTGKFAYLGVHFADENQAKFRGLSVRFHDLDEWFSKSAFSTHSPKSGSEVVTYEQPSPVKTSIRDFHIDFVVSGPGFSMDHFTHVNISQEARINIWSETEKNIDDFLPIIRHMQNFLTLGMSKPTFVTEVIGNTELAREENPTFYYPVKIYYLVDGWKPDPAQAHYFEMTFTLPAIEEKLEKILGIWISKAEVIKPVYDLYFSALYNPSIYQEFHFLSLVQAVETYHRQIYGGKYQSDEVFREDLYKILVSAIPDGIEKDFRSSLKQGKLRYANEYSLRKRLNLLSEHLAKNLKIKFLQEKKERNMFVDKVADTRNYFTHYPPELKDKAARSGHELHELTQKLRLILQVCFLEELDFTFDAIAEIFKKNREYKGYFS